MTNTELNNVIKRMRNAKLKASEVLKATTSTLEEREDASELLEEVDGLVKSMCEYTASVFNDERKNIKRTEMIRNANSIEEYQSMSENIERTRKSAHDDLIRRIKLTDLLCKINGTDEIYGQLPEEYKMDTSGLMGSKNRAKPGVVETRHAIADWTWQVVLGCTVEMYMEIGDYDKGFNEMESVSNVYNKKVGGAKGAKKMIDEMLEIDK